jgi:hypothetical protein
MWKCIKLVKLLWHIMVHGQQNTKFIVGSGPAVTAPHSWLHPTTTDQTGRIVIHIQWTHELRPAWHTTNLGYDQNFVLTHDQISSYDPRQRQRGQHISGITCSSVRALAVFALFCRRDHANSSYQSMYSINKYRVTEKGCVLLTARSSINQALRPAWRS